MEGDLESNLMQVSTILFEAGQKQIVEAVFREFDLSYSWLGLSCAGLAVIAGSQAERETETISIIAGINPGYHLQKDRHLLLGAKISD
jgi:hypothetical protein